MNNKRRLLALVSALLLAAFAVSAVFAQSQGNPPDHAPSLGHSKQLETILETGGNVDGDGKGTGDHGEGTEPVKNGNDCPNSVKENHFCSDNGSQHQWAMPNCNALDSHMNRGWDLRFTENCGAKPVLSPTPEPDPDKDPESTPTPTPNSTPSTEVCTDDTCGCEEWGPETISWANSLVLRITGFDLGLEYIPNPKCECKEIGINTRNAIATIVDAMFQYLRTQSIIKFQ